MKGRIESDVSSLMYLSVCIHWNGSFRLVIMIIGSYSGSYSGSTALFESGRHLENGDRQRTRNEIMLFYASFVHIIQAELTTKRRGQ